MHSINIWQFLAGLGLFLLGMNHLEKALRRLSGRTFARFLRKFTRNSFVSILAGTLATAILQSSSVVTLMIMALVGAGIIPMRNAIGVVIGSNLGTTLTGWIVATFGFKVDFGSFIMPLLALGSLGLVFFLQNTRSRQIALGVFGFGMLFLGLDHMKTSMATLETQVNMEWMIDYPPAIFLLFGFVFTALIQSSSATMTITLSALSAGLFDLGTAAALIIGADLGTTSTAIIGGIKGSPSKKRIALAHFVFNIVTDILAFSFIVPLLNFINTTGIQDPLYALVGFHSLFNICGIILFSPFLQPFAKFLEKFFVKPHSEIAKHIQYSDPRLPEVAIDDLYLEVRNYIEQSHNIIIRSLMEEELPIFTPEKMSFTESYQFLKSLEGEILRFIAALNRQALCKADSEKLSQMLQVIRSASHSAKCARDINGNAQEFYRSGHSTLQHLTLELNSELDSFLARLNAVWAVKEDAELFAIFNVLIQDNKESHDSFFQSLMTSSDQEKIDDMQFATFVHMSREIYSCIDSAVNALKTFLTPETKI